LTILLYLFFTGFEIFALNWISINGEVIGIESNEYISNTKYNGTVTKVIYTLNVKYNIDNVEYVNKLYTTMKTGIKNNINIKYNPENKNMIMYKKFDIFFAIGCLFAIFIEFIFIIKTIIDNKKIRKLT
jgi:hypothetical protein